MGERGSNNVTLDVAIYVILIPLLSYVLVDNWRLHGVVSLLLLVLALGVDWFLDRAKQQRQENTLLLQKRGYP